MKNNFIIALIIAIIFSSNLIAENPDSTSNSNNKLFIYPYAFYTPETQLAFGGGGIYYFRSSKNQKTKPSSIVFSGYYTTNKQFYTDVKPKIYFGNESYYLNSKFSYSKLAEDFYGIGSRTDKIENSEYLSQIAQVNIDFRKLLNYNFQIGITYDGEYRTITDTKENPFLKNKSVVGSDGGFVSAIGFTLCNDSRDNLFFPVKGLFYEITNLYYRDFIGSKYTFTSWKINLRNYISLSENTVFAAQIYGEFLSGNPPFYKLPRLGGAHIMRGYLRGRFRDKNYYAIQSELRTHIWKNFGAVIFISMGDVSPSFNSFKLVNAKYSYGFGLRYRFDKKEKLDVRVDFGFGKNSSGVYFGIEQAF